MNCSFNIRYKPRTTRLYTKNDLTVYDSAGNTALNALTIFGKSEVVDGSIISAGEGWATVDLGTLEWIKGYRNNTDTGYTFYSYSLSTVKQGSKIFAANLNYVTAPIPWEDLTNKQISIAGTSTLIISYDANTTTDLITALTGEKIIYELADPTQGNAIAVKTDNGSGIDGTMAVFETGTPLRGIPDTAVKDSMYWDGSSGEVTKNCGSAVLGSTAWAYNDNLHCFQSSAAFTFPNNAIGLLPLYALRVGIDAGLLNDKEYTLSSNGRVYIKDTDYTDATAFKNSLNGVKLVYELATPTTTPLTTAENASIAGLRTFEPQTHAQNNAQAEMTVDYTIKVPTI